ncbi:hypothetical protein GQX73_g10858 [Xylaria multiplex]|uniref:Rhodopsin domain-containing protein n=1 Tax=Xylaria multiplex TaxID=323545 RepID=A0A7C8MK80_9PEZI|nr:hypothetical protein GQX73_g10858 [Xylaria multiplex]
MDVLIKPTTIPPRSYMAAEVTLDVVTATFVFTRLMWNYHHSRKLFTDDYLCIVALMFIGAFSATSLTLNSTFFRKPSDVPISFLTSLSAAGICAGTAAMYFSKLLLIALIIRLFKIKKSLRYTSYILMAVTAIGFIAAALFTICASATVITGLLRNSLSLAADVVIFILPLKPISQLQLPLPKKIGIAVVFLFGSFAIIASIVSLYFQTAQLAGKSSNYANATLATAVECSIIVIVSCAPALMVLGSHCFSTLHASSKSLPSFSYSKSHARTVIRSPSEPKREYTDTALHEYIELDDYSNIQGASYNSQNKALCVTRKTPSLHPFNQSEGPTGLGADLIVYWLTEEVTRAYLLQEGPTVKTF